MIEIIFILIGVLSLLIVYQRTTETFNDYTNNKLVNLINKYKDTYGSSMSSITDLINKMNKNMPRNYYYDDNNKLIKSTHVDSLNEKIALVDAIKINNYVDDYVNEMQSVYNTCYNHKEGPCNNQCKILAPEICLAE